MTRVKWLVTGILVLVAPNCVPRLDPVGRWAIVAANEFDVTPNIVYGRVNHTDLRLDVITVAPKSEMLPTLIFIHGGGWVGGSKEVNMLRSLPYLVRGMNVVNVEYRMASVALAPAAVEDCRCALHWVYRHAKEFGFDTTRIVVAGRSAGGHLSLMTGMLEPSAGFDKECPASERLKVAAIINFYGITDVSDLLEGPNMRDFAVEWFAGIPNRMELARRLSPLTYVRPGLPPILTLQGDSDPTVPYQHGVRLHHALDDAGVPNQLLTIPGGGHDSWSRGENLRAQEAIFKFLEQYNILRPGSSSEQSGHAIPSDR
jgi:acetyl esterase/lipase